MGRTDPCFFDVPGVGHLEVDLEGDGRGGGDGEDGGVVTIRHPLEVGAARDTRMP